jgi:tellurite resistance protein
MTATTETLSSDRTQEVAGPDLRAPSRLLNVFAIPLGIAGLAGVWQAAQTTVDAPAWPAEVLYAISALLWGILTATYGVGASRRSGALAGDRQHAFYGPFAAYIPIIGILLASHYEQHARTVGQVGVVVFVAALGVLVGQLLAHWLMGNLPMQTFHPGYFLPTVAGPFIASIGLGLSGWRDAAFSAFGVGVVFWLVVGTLIFSRLFTGARLPDPLLPLLSVLVSPPATAGIAWFVLSGRMDAIGYALLGNLLLMLLVQALFFSEYRRLRFTTTFWAFTFPIGASVNVLVRWLSSTRRTGWQLCSWSLVGAATAALVLIAAATVLDTARHRRLGG